MTRTVDVASRPIWVSVATILAALIAFAISAAHVEYLVAGSAAALAMAIGIHITPALLRAWRAYAATIGRAISTVLVLTLILLAFIHNLEFSHPAPGQPDAYLILDYKATATLERDGELYGSEVYTINFHPGDIRLYRIDGLSAENQPWPSRVQVQTQMVPSATAGQPGIMVTARGRLNSETTRIGWLRRRVRFSAPKPRLQFSPIDDHAGLQPFALTLGSDFVFVQSAYLEVKMPRNSYLSSVPAGLINELPDHERVSIDFRSGQWPALELNQLTSLRLESLRSALQDDSPLDLLLKGLALFVWPVALFVLGHVHSRLGERLLDLVKPKQRKQKAGF